MLSDATKLDAANTAYMAASESIFSKDLPGSFGLITEQTDDHENNLAEWLDAGVTPMMRRWNGSKEHEGFRILRQTARIEPFAVGIELKRRDVLRDKSGVVNRRINTFLTNTAGELNRQVWEAFIANPTGIDGVALLSDSHPYGYGSTGLWDNLTTDALSFTAFNAARAAMRGFRHHNGKFFGVKPTHLFVGPAKERLAKEIVGANRYLTLATAGTEAGVVGATTIDNVYKGDCEVVVVDEFANGTNGDDWVMADLRPGIGKPVWLVLDRAPEGISMFNMDDPERYNRDVFQASVEGDWAIAGLYPHAIYGKHT